MKKTQDTEDIERILSSEKVASAFQRGLHALMDLHEAIQYCKRHHREKQRLTKVTLYCRKSK